MTRITSVYVRIVVETNKGEEETVLVMDEDETFSQFRGRVQRQLKSMTDD